MKEKKIYIIILFFLVKSLAGFTQLQKDSSKNGVNQIQTDSIINSEPKPFHNNENVNKDSLSYFDLVRNVHITDKRTIPDSQISKIKANADYWYVNTIPKKQSKYNINTPNSFHFISSNIFLTILIVIFAAVILWFIIFSNKSLFRKKPIAHNIITDTNESIQDIFSIDFVHALNEAISEERYRHGVRLLYLQTLKLLSESGQITYQPDLTNNYYVSQLYKTIYYELFFALTRKFEFIWYGEHNITKDDFKLVQQQFLNLQNQLAA